MSNYCAKAKRPNSDKIEDVIMIDTGNVFDKESIALKNLKNKIKQLKNIC